MEDKEVQPMQQVNTGVKTVQVRLEWVLAKKTIENLQENRSIFSPNYDIQLDKENASWNLKMDEGEDLALGLFLFRRSWFDSRIKYVNFNMSIKGDDGDLLMTKRCPDVKLSEFGNSTGRGWKGFCDKTDLEEHEMYINDKMTIVCDLTFTIEKEQRIRNRTCAKQRYDTEDSETEFVKNMKTLYASNSFSDLVIFCGDQKFLCHKIVLASRSDTFKEMLESEEKKINGELEITETDPNVFKLLVDHIYTGKIPKDIGNVSKELYKLAIKYNLQILAKACEISLLDQITDENALDTLVIMDQNKIATSTKNDVIKYITINAKDIIDTEGFKTFSKEHPELMIEIVRCFSDIQNKEVLSSLKTEGTA